MARPRRAKRMGGAGVRILPVLPDSRLERNDPQPGFGDLSPSCSFEARICSDSMNFHDKNRQWLYVVTGPFGSFETVYVRQPNRIRDCQPTESRPEVDRAGGRFTTRWRPCRFSNGNRLRSRCERARRHSRRSDLYRERQTLSQPDYPTCRFVRRCPSFGNNLDAGRSVARGDVLARTADNCFAAIAGSAGYRRRRWADGSDPLSGASSRNGSRSCRRSAHRRAERQPQRGTFANMRRPRRTRTGRTDRSAPRWRPNLGGH